MAHLHSTSGDGGVDLLPFGFEGGEALFAPGAKAVVAAGAAADGFGTLEEHSLLQQAVQDGVDAAFAEFEGAGGTALNLGDELVAIHFVGGEEPEDEEFRDAIEEVFFGLHWV
jgi:hypothetical protein